MASIEKRSGNWRAKVRKSGSPSLNKTFTKKSDAVRWAAERVGEQAISDFAFPRYCDGKRAQSGSASAALNKWLKSKVPEGCVVHSFRHSLRDRLRAVECRADIIDQIGGRSTAGVGQGYGKGYPLKALEGWLRRIE